MTDALTDRRGQEDIATIAPRRVRPVLQAEPDGLNAEPKWATAVVVDAPKEDKQPEYVTLYFIVDAKPVAFAVERHVASALVRGIVEKLA